MRNLEQVRTEMGKTHQDYLKARERGAPESEWRPIGDKVIALQKELSSEIAEGGDPCSDCENKPIGLRHMSVNAKTRKTTYTYELGCPHCMDHRAIGNTREEAVKAWNDKDFLPSKEAPKS